MKKILFNKLAITLGLILAALNLIFPGYSAILCAINPTKDFCGEAWAAMIINTPTFQLLSWPFPAHTSERIGFIILAISGIIQYFIIGYLLGQLILFIKRSLKHVS
jgi:hypothetical protein